MNLISYMNGEKRKYLNERAFAYELYRQIANRLYDDMSDCDKWKDKAPEIVINAEIHKSLYPKRSKYPDIVIHGGQFDTTRQLLICEIKKGGRQNGIKKDLQKRNDNMFNHPFSLAIFINVGSCESFEKHPKKISLEGNNHDCLLLVSYDKGEVKIFRIAQHV